MEQTEHIYQLFLNCKQKICIDTRSINIKNSIFFGIKGEKFDGNLYAKKAIEKGAKYAIVDKKEYNDHRIIQVKNSLICLQKIAKFHRERLDIPIIAITGTNGKTTTKELINSILATRFSSICTQKNLNNHIGVPLTILRIKKNHQIAVIELGANHTGEIEFLCSIAKPTHGIITNIGKAHLEGFKNVENIIKTKGELYHFLKENNGTIFTNKSDPVLLDLNKRYAKSVFYDSKNFDEKLKFECNPFIKIIWEKKVIQTNVIGNYNIDNINASIAIAKYFKISEFDIAKSLQNIKFKNNRSEFIKTKFNDIILDAYNANPTSMECAINNFFDIINQKKYSEYIIVLGDMLELGPEDLKHHQEIVNLLSLNKCLQCVLVGPIFIKTKYPDHFITCISNIDCEKKMKDLNLKNSLILIKGSRKMQLESIIKVL